MQVKTIGKLKQLVNDHGMTVGDDGVATMKPAEPKSLPVPQSNNELLQAVRELTAAMQTKEPPIVVQSPVPDRPQRWVFTVERNFEGITRIVAEAK